MLLFQIDWNHIVAGCKRAGIDPRWLVEVVAEINLYLPDDWRITRSTNNFRVQIIGERAPALVGRSYRSQGDEILHIIDSIFLKGFHDKFDLAQVTGGAKDPVSGRVKKEHPEIIVPNLYFFRPCPDDSDSPLFARQYEKIKVDRNGRPVGDQFHRIHPLTKAGLDLTHFRWVRWTTNGDVEPVKTVEPEFSEYHGKNYWETPFLKTSSKRGESQDYLKRYEAVLKNAGITPPQPHERPPSPYEREYKMLVPGKAPEVQQVFSLIHDAVQETGFTIRPDSDKSAKKQTDLYFDDDSLTLHSIGASFRLREKKGTLRVTLKKRLPSMKLYSERGLYERIEEEIVITGPQKKALLAGEPINVLPYRLLAYVAPYCGKLQAKVTVTNNRKTLILEDADHRPAELCLDQVTYDIAGIKNGPYFEVEIESKGANREKIEELAYYLEENLGLIPSRQSKYERGISLLKIAGIPKEKKIVIIDTDCGVDDALALILALKSPELEVKAITTVSGNVHVDKVIPNVFKVFDALKLNEHPLVARGAEQPLKIVRKEAESVHGVDGLGDAIANPSHMPIDPRPAWKVICDLARQNSKQITLITIGPLTNLARAIQNDPEGVRCLKKVVTMGGVFFEVGNVGPDAEFNVAADPDAAYEVVKFCRDSCLKTPVDREGKEVILPPDPKKEDYEKTIDYRKHDPNDPNMVPLTFVGLDVTHKVLLRRAAMDRAVKAHPRNNLLKFVQDISKKYMDFYYDNEWLPGCYLHDPLAVAFAINPAFLEIEERIIHVETETVGNFTGGVIFPDDRPTRNPAWRNPAEEVIGIARRAEREAFEEFFLMRLIEK